MQNIRENGVPVGFFPRLAAYLIDMILVGIVLGMVRCPFAIVSWFIGNVFWKQQILFCFSLLDIGLYLLGVSYFILFTYYSGATLGKKAMNIKVVSSKEDKLTWLQVIYRETIGRFLSGFIMELGYLLVLVDNQKQGLHDKLADTQVVYHKIEQEVCEMAVEQPMYEVEEVKEKDEIV